MLPWLVGMAIISAVTAGYLIWGNGALGLENQEAEGFRETGLANMFNIDRNLTNLTVALDISTGTVLFFVVLAAGLIAYVIAKRQQKETVPLNWLWVLLPYILGNALITSSVVYANLERGGYGRIRFMFPAAIAVCMIFALCVVQIYLTIQNRGGVVRYAPTVAFSALMIIPAIFGNTAQIRQYALPDTNLLLWRWSDASIPVDGANSYAARESNAPCLEPSVQRL